MKHLKLLLFLVFSITFSSCSEVNSENPKEIFELWTGSELPKDIELVNGKYWESAHWSKEYEVYAEIKSTETWWNDFKNNNQLEDFKSSLNNDIEEKFFKNKNEEIIKQPHWFKPDKSSEIYIKGSSEFFWNPKTNTIFIHEIQL